MKAQNIMLLWFIFLFTAEGVRAEDRLRERIYIQTDKQIYFAGEQLWLKLYLTDAQGNPQTLSKVGYVELIDENMPQIRQKIEIENGTGTGMFMLPSQLATGYYRLTAYTRYMQNEGETVYFQKYIGIVNTLRTDRRIRTDTSLSVTPPSSGNNNLTVSSSNDLYMTRMQGEICIEGLPDNVHSLAVSIAGEEFIPLPDEEVTLPAWKQRLSSLTEKAFQLNLLPEYEGLILNGQLVDAQTGEPVNDKPGMILGFSDDGLRVSGGEVDESGQVSFHTGQVSGRHKLGIAFFPANDNKYNVKLQSPFAAHTLESPPRFALNPAWEEKLVQRSVGVQVMYTYLLDSLYLQSNIPLPHIRWKPDYSYILDEYNRFDRLNTMFIEFIPYLGFHTVGGERKLSVRTSEYRLSGNSLMLLDGVPVNDAEFFYNLNTRVLKRVDVYRGRFFIAGHIFDGVGSFVSFDNNCPGLQSGDFLQLEEYEGTQPVFRFYAPAYTEDIMVDEKRRIPDYRHTLLWEPEVQTNGQSSLVIPFSTSDLTGDYRITVEGLTRDGQPLRGVARFRVGASLSIDTMLSEQVMAEINPAINTTFMQSEFIGTDTIITELALPDSVPVFRLDASTTMSDTTTVMTASRQVSATTTPTTAASANNEVLARVRIAPGERLTLIAEKYYGLKVFWVYIYVYNKATIGSNPNLVPAGMELLVPAKEMYDIDASNPDSVEKATALERSITGGIER